MKKHKHVLNTYYIPDIILSTWIVFRYFILKILFVIVLMTKLMYREVKQFAQIHTLVSVGKSTVQRRQRLAAGPNSSYTATLYDTEDFILQSWVDYNVGQTQHAENIEPIVVYQFCSDLFSSPIFSLPMVRLLYIWRWTLKNIVYTAERLMHRSVFMITTHFLSS